MGQGKGQARSSAGVVAGGAGDQAGLEGGEGVELLGGEGGLEEAGGVQEEEVGVRQQRRLQCYCPGIGEVEQRSGEGWLNKRMFGLKLGWVDGETGLDSIYEHKLRIFRAQGFEDGVYACVKGAVFNVCSDGL